jgi:hypothetical protein
MVILRTTTLLTYQLIKFIELYFSIKDILKKKIWSKFVKPTIQTYFNNVRLLTSTVWDIYQILTWNITFLEWKIHNVNLNYCHLWSIWCIFCSRQKKMKHGIIWRDRSIITIIFYFFWCIDPIVGSARSIGCTANPATDFLEFPYEEGDRSHFLHVAACMSLIFGSGREQ